MKIGSLDTKPPVTAPTERKAGPTQTEKPAEASAHVALSSAATSLAGTPTDATFDGKKVDRIAQAIRDGKFEINAEAIADKLIINAQELLGRKVN